MNILREIQSDLLKEERDFAQILLKLQFLAARLDSEPLEEWVKLESEGYSTDASVPDYRKLAVHLKH